MRCGALKRYLCRSAMLLVVATLSCLHAHARDTTLDVVLWEVPEQDWQAEGEPLLADGPALTAALQKPGSKARALATAELALKPEGRSEWKRGAEMTYATGYAQQDVPTQVKAVTTEQRFVGTWIEAAVQGMDGDGVELELRVRHDLGAPGSRHLVFAPAATGRDRAVQSVPMPEFYGIDWQGMLRIASNRWLLAASLLQTDGVESRAAAAKRLLIMIRLHGAPAQLDALAMPSARQRVIRAPELAVASLLASPAVTDRELLEKIGQMIKDGKARVMSDVQAAFGGVNSEQFLRLGRQTVWPSERDQDTDNLVMPPTAVATRFTGTALNRADGAALDAPWRGGFAPRGPESFQWPVVWPASRQQAPGWLDELDTFEEQLQVPAAGRPGRPGIAAVLPPADAVWPGTGERCLDLFEAVLTGPATAKEEQSAGTSDDTHRLSLLAIEVSAHEALQTAGSHRSDGDEALLQRLLKQCAEGEAWLRLCLSTRVAQGGDSEIESARQHTYPVEMQTFPSAWNMLPVGCQLRVGQSAPDRYEIDLSYAPDRPRLAEWTMCLDRPLLMAWQPSFRTNSLTLEAVVPPSGCRLVAVQKVPEALHPGEGGRSVLFFACASSGRPPNVQPDASPPVRLLQAEFLAFEVSGAERSTWPEPGDATEIKRWDDRKGLLRLLERVKAGTAKLAAHTAVQVGGSGGLRVEEVEQVPHVTEYDPDDHKPARHYRPTAFDVIPTGDRVHLEMGERSSGEASGIVSVRYLIQHDTAMPVEPGLAQILSHNEGREQQEVPEAVTFALQWAGDAELSPGGVVCLGVLPVQTRDGAERCRVAYLRIVEQP